MKKELILKRCKSCGALVKVLKDCNCAGCGIQCCGESMELVKANSVDASFEKHVPTYEIVDNEIVVKVNHVMEEEHYIEWISLVSDNIEITVNLAPGQEAIAKFPYVKEATIYSYCNKHGLWSCEVE